MSIYMYQATQASHPRRQWYSIENQIPSIYKMKLQKAWKNLTHQLNQFSARKTVKSDW
jgi:hypothetical protein